MQELEPKTNEGGAALLQRASLANKRAVEIGDFILVHMEIQAKLHRLDPKLDTANPASTYHQVLICAARAPAMEHFVQPAHDNDSPIQTDLLQFYAAFRQAVGEHVSFTIAAAHHAAEL